jgi:hypothetical protein
LQYREHTCQPSPASQASKKLRAVWSIELFIGSLQQEDTTSEIVEKVAKRQFAVKVAACSAHHPGLAP